MPDACPLGSELLTFRTPRQVPETPGIDWVGISVPSVGQETLEPHGQSLASGSRRAGVRIRVSDLLALHRASQGPCSGRKGPSDVGP